MYIYTYYSIKILDKKVPTLKEIPRSALGLDVIISGSEKTCSM
jgi:hypothetical protein